MSAPEEPHIREESPFRAVLAAYLWLSVFCAVAGSAAVLYQWARDPAAAPEAAPAAAPAASAAQGVRPTAPLPALGDASVHGEPARH